MGAHVKPGRHYAVAHAAHALATRGASATSAHSKAQAWRQWAPRQRPAPQTIDKSPLALHDGPSDHLTDRVTVHDARLIAQTCAKATVRAHRGDKAMLSRSRLYGLRILPTVLLAAGLTALAVRLDFPTASGADVALETASETPSGVPVDIYFNVAEANVADCTSVAPFRRHVREATPQAVLTELFAGPSIEEIDAGAQPYFGAGTQGLLRTVDVGNREVSVDLGDLGDLVGVDGGCSMEMLTSAITATVAAVAPKSEVLIDTPRQPGQIDEILEDAPSFADVPSTATPSGGQ